ncbi:SAV_915 family protein [Kineococcus sp. SYSU DK002]|uniref:SAV_915 family protein n=1 Tax=Kineococcus sp. SYSU DK002 TaxID=3383123 RepID=UPI003D7EDBF9
MHSTPAPAAEPSPSRVFVPAHRGPRAVVLRTFLDPLGVRTGVAFSSPALLRAVLGEDQAHVELGVGAVRALLRAAGTQDLRIDPRLVAAPPADRGPSAATPAPVPAVPRARLRVEGFAA